MEDSAAIATAEKKARRAANERARRRSEAGPSRALRLERNTERLRVRREEEEGDEERALRLERDTDRHRVYREEEARRRAEEEELVRTRRVNMVAQPTIDDLKDFERDPEASLLMFHDMLGDDRLLSPPPQNMTAEEEATYVADVKAACYVSLDDKERVVESWKSILGHGCVTSSLI